MDRYAKIVERIVAAKERPATMFEAAFFELREKAKALKEKWSQEAAANLAKELKADLADKGYEVTSFDMSLGQYRGSRFVTSAKLTVSGASDADAKKLEKYLQGKYSPKFRLKAYNPETKTADYIVR